MSESMIRWLYGLQHFGIKLGLDQIRALLEELGRPDRAAASVLVAGTNGKGSVAAMLDGLLAAHDVPAGLFTSPHLVKPNERIRLAGRDIADDELDRRLAAMRERIEAGLARGALEAHPSFFEVVTAVALEAFRDHGLRAAVLEVGLGGRLDATNAVDAGVSVIVSIDLDHTKTLGDTIEKIAWEKAGIVKPGRPVVSGVVQQGALNVIDRVCRRQAAPLVDARARIRFVGERPGEFDLAGPSRGYPRLTLSLAGRHQVDNARTALAAFELLAERLDLRPDPDAVRQGLASVRWPGRLQWVDDPAGGPRVLLDGAHNPAGLQTLLTYLDALDAPRPVLLFGATKGKPIEELLAPLAARAEAVVLTRPPVEKGLPVEEVEPVAAALCPKLHLAEDPAHAFDLARRLADGRWVLVSGSLYLVGEVLGLLSGERLPGPVSM